MHKATYMHSFKGILYFESLSRNILMTHTMKNLDLVNAFINPVDDSITVLERRRMDILCISHRKRRSTTCRVKGQSVPGQEVKSWPCVAWFRGRAHTGMVLGFQQQGFLAFDPCASVNTSL